jgi:hypothetical protein
MVTGKMDQGRETESNVLEEREKEVALVRNGIGMGQNGH